MNLFFFLRSIILFIVEDVTHNICDQRFLEFEIRRKHPEIRVVRKTLTEVAKEGRLRGEERRLVVGQDEVAVVYFRCGYSPDQYPTEAEWEARLVMERSRAVKSPSIHLHLAGTKKVQQELARPGVLEKFVRDPAEVEAIRRVFTGLYPVDKSEEGKKAFAAALSEPDKFVLKPQREGGGNNVYGQDIGPFLRKIQDSSERDAFILMDRIRPPKTKNYLLRAGAETKDVKEVISELGVFGYVIGTGENITANKQVLIIFRSKIPVSISRFYLSFFLQVGHMLRTKLADVNEGGVAAGSGALDSVYLVDLPEKQKS